MVTDVPTAITILVLRYILSSPSPSPGGSRPKECQHPHRCYGIFSSTDVAAPAGTPRTLSLNLLSTSMAAVVSFFL